MNILQAVAITAPLAILFRPCSWCTPRAELERLNREYPGQVSHSMCDACLQRFETTGTVKDSK